MACFSRVLKPATPFIVMFLTIAGFHYTNLIFFKYYPPVINFAFFALFFSSLFQEKTVIQRIALAMEPDAGAEVMRYTRNLTYVWATFTFINFCISLATVFMSERIWAFYNGFLSYLFVGIFFAVEYIVRINFKRKYGQR